MQGAAYNDYMFHLMRQVLDEIGPRASCSPEEKMLADKIEKEWKPLCDDVQYETYDCHPRAFLAPIPISVGTYLLGTIFYFVWSPLAAVISCLGLLLLVLETAGYREIIDPWFKKETGQNVIGRFKPSGEIRQRVIVTGHTDSAYEFNVWKYLRNASMVVMPIFGAAHFVLFGASTLKALDPFLNIASGDVLEILGIVILGLYPLVSLFWFFHTETPVPGAMDNLSAIAVTAGVAKYLAGAKTNNDFYPKNTEVLVIAMGGEEAGLRGSKRYVEKHGQMLKSIPTNALVLEAIAKEDHFGVFSRELSPGTKADGKLVQLICNAAKRLGLRPKAVSLPIGATDATSFLRSGICAATIFAQDSTKLVPEYHTRLDTLDKVRPEALVAGLDVTMDVIRQIDLQATTGSQNDAST